MSSKKEKQTTVKTKQQQEVDEQIIALKVQMEESGIHDDELIIAVARIYANSTLMAYKEYYGA